MPLNASDRRWIALAVGLLVTAVLSCLARRAPVREHGWRRLEPGPAHWTVLVLGGLLFLVCLYVRLFVGSRRRDAEHQMNVLTGLIVAFGLMVVLSGWWIRRLRTHSFEWRGDVLAWRDGQGGRRVRRTDELTSVRRSLFGTTRLGFLDGERVQLDEHAQGCAELIRHLAEWRPDLLRR